MYDKNEKVDGNIVKYEIIDGQQRITTFSLLLLGIYHLAFSYAVSTSDMTLNNIKSALWKVINRKFKKNLPIMKGIIKERCVK